MGIGQTGEGVRRPGPGLTQPLLRASYISTPEAILR